MRSVATEANATFVYRFEDGLMDRGMNGFLPRALSLFRQDKPMEIKEHREIIGADGVNVGTVDKVEGSRTKLTKRTAPRDRHHFIKKHMPLAGTVNMTKRRKPAKSKRKILAVDVGGTHVKCEVSGQSERREFESGPKLSAKRMVREVKRLTSDWSYEAVSYTHLTLPTICSV